MSDATSPTGLGPFERVRELSPQAPLPRLIPVRQHYDVPAEPDVAAATARELEALRSRIRPGMSVAVTAGSRGIHDLATVVRAACDWLRAAGAEPFVVPAMGSHGGATAEGQVAVLASYGVTEETMGVPIRATMDTVELGRVPDGPMVHLDANAAQADGILLVNRIKPHTDFHGEIESGLGKIAAIGLGKQRGAEGIHIYGSTGLARWIPAVGRHIVETGRVLGGIGIVENAHERTARIAFVEPDGIAGPAETALLAEAGRLLGRLPFDELDVLVVDELGKDKSGSGMDTNVIGRMWIAGVDEPDRPRVTNITVHGISKASYGNAVGVGLADFVPFRVLEDIDLHALYVNAMTSGIGGVRRAKLPIALPTDEATVAAAILMCGRPDPENVRLVRVHDTLDTVHLLVAESLRAEVEAQSQLEIVGEPVPFDCTPDGALPAWPPLEA
ncbi:DUF2088 domain-containing protein [Actinopolymorpha singaporensis]|uniref:LarA-like N-terminal domain-containing protein n=1 Tax=Actinopolymorpha singaporensis TaxID=117157 RepID=A0A1H1WJ47_9ACTN|nr:DUF2088 domain-containing protein [Actinopolymorpha singaporensis]SDS96336.1 hypothetical protein SAMN04489717_4512 [Actinopolymorpha singaporensis]